MINATNKRRKAYAADLQAMGLQWVDSYTVFNPRTGETGTRYELDSMPTREQLDHCPKRKPAGLQIHG